MLSTMQRLGAHHGGGFLRSFSRHLLLTRTVPTTPTGTGTTASDALKHLSISSSPFRSLSSKSSKKPGSDVTSDQQIEVHHVEDDDQVPDDDNLLSGKDTRENLHAALRARAVDVIRYDYFAQRAEVECEVEAAALLRGLGASAREQALGHMELLEEYGDEEYMSTMDNVDAMADHERQAADGVLRQYAGVAAEEELDGIEEWFDDVADAGVRAADRLEETHAGMEEDMMGVGDEEEGGEGGEEVRRPLQSEEDVEAFKNRNKRR